MDSDLSYIDWLFSLFSQVYFIFKIHPHVDWSNIRVMFQNCAPSVVERMRNMMYDDCLAWEEIGGADFDQFCENIKLICAEKDGDFEWEMVTDCREFIYANYARKYNLPFACENNIYRGTIVFQGTCKGHNFHSEYRSCVAGIINHSAIHLCV